MNKKQILLDFQRAKELLSVVNPTAQETNDIYRIYKTYIDTGALPPTSGCNSCSTSLYKYWSEMCRWYSKIEEEIKNNTL